MCQFHSHYRKQYAGKENNSNRTHLHRRSLAFSATSARRGGLSAQYPAWPVSCLSGPKSPTSGIQTLTLLRMGHVNPCSKHSRARPLFTTGPSTHTAAWSRDSAPCGDGALSSPVNHQAAPQRPLGYQQRQQDGQVQPAQTRSVSTPNSGERNRAALALVLTTTQRRSLEVLTRGTPRLDLCSTPCCPKPRNAHVSPPRVLLPSGRSAQRQSAGWWPKGAHWRHPLSLFFLFLLFTDDRRRDRRLAAVALQTHRTAHPMIARCLPLHPVESTRPHQHLLNASRVRLPRGFLYRGRDLRHGASVVSSMPPDKRAGSQR